MGTVAALARFLDAEPQAHRRAELVARFSRHSLDRALADGAAIRAAPGIFLGAAWRDDLRSRISAASLWGGDASAVGGAAALSAHVGYARPVGTVTVVTRRPRHAIAPAGVALRRLVVEIRPVTIAGARVVPAVDASIQAWPELPRRDRVGATLDLLRAANMSGAAVLDRLTAYPRVSGRRSLVALLEVASGGVTSYLEYRARTRVFAGPTFAALEWQAPVRVAGRRVVVDAIDRETGVAIEFDGRAFHGDDGARRRDIERDALLAAAGCVVLRFTYEDVVGRPAWCRTQVGRTMAARGGGWGGRRAAAVQ
jgi:very-short-patch-repair endonuclease